MTYIDGVIGEVIYLPWDAPEYCLHAIGEASDEVKQVLAELSRRFLEAERDAARYRWLRDAAHPDSDSGLCIASWETSDWGNHYMKHHSGPSLDVVIDAATADSASDDYEQEELERMLKQEAKAHAAASASGVANGSDDRPDPDSESERDALLKAMEVIATGGSSASWGDVYRAQTERIAQLERELADVRIHAQRVHEKAVPLKTEVVRFRQIISDCWGILGVIGGSPPHHHTIQDRVGLAVSMLCDEQARADKALRELAEARGLLLALANAADEVGVRHFDHDSLPRCVVKMQEATEAVRSALRGTTPDQPAPLAYHETHEPPHCPTCGCAADQPQTQSTWQGWNRDADNWVHHAAVYSRMLTEPEVMRLYAGELPTTVATDALVAYYVNGQATITDQPDAVDYKALYHELLYAVASKYPGESRHQTALRYIQQAERIDGTAQQAASETVSEVQK